MWRVVFGFAVKPRDAVKWILAERHPLWGVVWGVLGALAFPALSLLTRYVSDEFVEVGVPHFLQVETLVAAGTYVLDCLVIFLFALLWGGRGNPLRYASVAGWAGAFEVFWVVLMLPVIVLGSHLKEAEGVSKLLMTAVIMMPLFGVLGLVLAWFRFQAAAIAEVLSLSQGRAWAVFMILILPLFLFYDTVL